MHWRRKWQPTPVFLPGESQGWGSLVGRCLWGHTESDTTEATQQQQQQEANFFFFCTKKRLAEDVVGVGVSVLGRPRRILLSYKLNHHNP